MSQKIDTFYYTVEMQTDKFKAALDKMQSDVGKASVIINDALDKLKFQKEMGVDTSKATAQIQAFLDENAGKYNELLQKLQDNPFTVNVEEQKFLESFKGMQEEITKTTTATQDLGKETAKTEGIMSKMGSFVTGIFQGMGQAIFQMGRQLLGNLVNFKEWIGEAVDAAKQVRLLDNALKNIGSSYKEMEPALNRLSKSKLMDKDQISQIISTGVSLGVTKDKLEAYAESAINYAEQSGKGLERAMQTAAAKAKEGGAAFDSFSNSVRGAREQVISTDGGLTALDVATKDLYETIGTALLPIMTSLIGAILPIIDAVKEWTLGFQGLEAQTSSLIGLTDEYNQITNTLNDTQNGLSTSKIIELESRQLELRDKMAARMDTLIEKSKEYFEGVDGKFGKAPKSQFQVDAEKIIELTSGIQKLSQGIVSAQGKGFNTDELVKQRQKMEIELNKLKQTLDSKKGEMEAAGKNIASAIANNILPKDETIAKLGGNLKRAVIEQLVSLQKGVDAQLDEYEKLTGSRVGGILLAAQNALKDKGKEGEVDKPKQTSTASTSTFNKSIVDTLSKGMEAGVLNAKEALKNLKDSKEFNDVIDAFNEANIDFTKPLTETGTKIAENYNRIIKFRDELNDKIKAASDKEKQNVDELAEKNKRAAEEEKERTKRQAELEKQMAENKRRDKEEELRYNVDLAEFKFNKAIEEKKNIEETRTAFIGALQEQKNSLAETKENELDRLQIQDRINEALKVGAKKTGETKNNIANTLDPMQLLTEGVKGIGEEIGGVTVETAELSEQFDIIRNGLEGVQELLGLQNTEITSKIQSALGAISKIESTLMNLSKIDFSNLGDILKPENFTSLLSAAGSAAGIIINGIAGIADALTDAYNANINIENSYEKQVAALDVIENSIRAYDDILQSIRAQFDYIDALAENRGGGRTAGDIEAEIAAQNTLIDTQKDKLKEAAKASEALAKGFIDMNGNIQGGVETSAKMLAESEKLIKSQTALEKLQSGLSDWKGFQGKNFFGGAELLAKGEADLQKQLSDLTNAGVISAEEYLAVLKAARDTDDTLYRKLTGQIDERLKGNIASLEGQATAYQTLIEGNTALLQLETKRKDLQAELAGKTTEDQKAFLEKQEEQLKKDRELAALKGEEVDGIDAAILANLDARIALETDILKKRDLEIERQKLLNGLNSDNLDTSKGITEEMTKQRDLTLAQLQQGIKTGAIDTENILQALNIQSILGKVSNTPLELSQGLSTLGVSQQTLNQGQSYVQNGSQTFNIYDANIGSTNSLAYLLRTKQFGG